LVSNEELTVCILTYRERDPSYLLKCLDSLRLIEVPFRVKILAQGGLREEGIQGIEELREKFEIELQTTPKNLGVGAGRQILFRDLKTKYLLSLDDDVYLLEGFQLAYNLIQREEVLQVGFAFCNPNKSFRFLGGMKYEIKNSEFRAYVPKAPVKADYVEVDQVFTGASLFKSLALNYAQPDPSYSYGLDDVDWNLQLYFSPLNMKNFISLRSKVCHQKFSPRKDYRLIEAYEHWKAKWKLNWQSLAHQVETLKKKLRT